MIISGGENVYRAEVENAPFSHAATEEAAVVGEPNEEWGELTVAYVVADGGLSADDLDRHLLDSDALADFKRPRAYYLVAELPKTRAGRYRSSNSARTKPTSGPTPRPSRPSSDTARSFRPSRFRGLGRRPLDRVGLSPAAWRTDQRSAVLGSVPSARPQSGRAPSRIVACASHARQIRR